MADGNIKFAVLTVEDSVRSLKDKLGSPYLTLGIYERQPMPNTEVEWIKYQSNHTLINELTGQVTGGPVLGLSSFPDNRHPKEIIENVVKKYKGQGPRIMPDIPYSKAYFPVSSARALLTEILGV